MHLCTYARVHICTDDNAAIHEDNVCGISIEDIDKFTELPPNWIHEPIHSLTGGQLLKVLVNALNGVDNKLDLKFAELDANYLKLETTIKKLSDDMKGKEEKLSTQSAEINTLKKVVCNQQLFLEKLQRKDLANNLIINGLPITDITLGDTLIAEPDDKVNAVLSIIGVPLSKDNYILTKFPLVEGRDTFSVKLTIDDIGTKNSILQNARKLKSTESLQKVYIKNDETRLARSENYRLRDKARKLRIQFPDTVVKIEKGKLLRDGVICDKFDINNQIFC